MNHRRYHLDKIDAAPGYFIIFSDLDLVYIDLNYLNVPQSSFDNVHSCYNP